MNKKRIDTALYPIYSTVNPNKSIQLYNGQFEIEQGNNKISTNGIIELVWLRSPKIEFSFIHKLSISENSINFATEPAMLRIPSCSNTIQVIMLQSGYINDEKGKRLICAGETIDTIQLGNGDNLSYLILHLPNFNDTLGKGISSVKNTIRWKGRFNLEDTEWKITIDKVENYAALYTELKATGGYAITHTIKIEKQDGSDFNIQETEELIDNLFYFLSFARGFWIEAALQVGFDKKEDRILEKWFRPRTDRWQNVDSWFNFFDPQILEFFWCDFCNYLQDSTWGETLKRAIQWYIHTNQKAGDLEGSIMLAQSAHELLSWTKFVTEMKLSDEGFKKLPASDKLRLILSEAKIPLQSPTSLKFLSQLCKSENWNDGAKALTEIRNNIVHPSPRNLQKLQRVGEDEMEDAYILTMWYLEMILLYLLGYRGEYINRIIYTKWRGQTEQVPWI